MNPGLEQRRPAFLPIRFIGSVALTLLLALSILYLIMQPPMSEFGPMALFLTITAVISVRGSA